MEYDTSEDPRDDSPYATLDDLNLMAEAIIEEVITSSCHAHSRTEELRAFVLQELRALNPDRYPCPHACHHPLPPPAPSPWWLAPSV